MASVINTNIQSLTAQRNLNTSQMQLSTSMQRLSSGLRINSAKDDAAGLAISERMTTQIRGLNQAGRNANDGISLAQTAEGALGTIGNNLQRIRELAVQSRNATNSTTDREALNSEVQQLKAEIGRVAQQTDFNGTKLLDGSFTSKAFQVGANQGQTIDIAQIANANTDKLGSWNSVATSASITGVVPAGTVPTTTAASGTFTSAVSDAIGQNFSLTVGGVSVLNRTTATVNDTIAAADIDTALGTKTAELSAAGITVSGTAQAGTLAFSKADGSDFNVTLTSTYGANAGGFATAGFVGAHTNGELTSTTFPATTANALKINGIGIDSVPAVTTAGQRASALVNAINSKTADTGVTASLVDGLVSLKSATGDITVGGIVAGTGLTAGVSGAAAGGTAYVAGTAKIGFADMDISTTEGADNAILAMDAALTAVNSARADLGAIQNRFTSVVDNLSTNSENLSASRSRIMDADFAQETANLSRTQILQQAGTAMVAQANQLPQNVLKLLQ